MAPISEKKLPPLYKQNSTENIAKDSMRKKTLEILDFRESWLEQLRRQTYKKGQVPLLDSYNNTNIIEAYYNSVTRHSTNDKKKIEEQTKKVLPNRIERPEQNKTNLALKIEEPTATDLDLIKKLQGGTQNVSKRSVHEKSKVFRVKTSPLKVVDNKTSDEGNFNTVINTFYASGLLNNEQYLHVEKTDPQKSPQQALLKHFPHESSDYQLKTNGNENQFETNPDRSLSTDIGTTPHGSDDDGEDAAGYESGEEYFGYPFYLREDSKTKHQSEKIETDSINYTPKSVLSPSLFPMVPPYLNFSTHYGEQNSIPSSLRKILKWRLSPAMPKIVKRVVLNSGFRLIKNTTDWMGVWERHMKSPSFKTIHLHQKYNHLPGSFRIGRKDTMWRSLHTNITKFGKREFGIMQTTFVLPEDLKRFRKSWPRYSKKSTKWIVKPPASARGCGISVINKWSQIPKDIPIIVQKYIERPLLINENKFDLRLYILVTSTNPLRIFMYKNGLARFASVKYDVESNSLDEKCMHLTNYSINKFSENYSKNEDVYACQGHKWSLQSLWSLLEKRNVNTALLWATLRNLVIKAIVSGESALNRMYRQNVNSRYNCFELLGFDVLLDEDMVPWLLEINISPSMHSELALDYHIKGPLLQAVLNTVLYQVPPKLTKEQQEEILEQMEIQGPLCYDHRIFTTCLTNDEIRKHNQFTKPAIEYREEYLESILEDLKPDDIRCLIVLEDELARSQPLERIFPTAESHIYLKYIENPRYYNRLIDAWESKYANNRPEGIALLTNLCSRGLHLQVSSDAALKEPNVEFTDIDMMYTRKNVLDPNFDIDDIFSADNSSDADGIGQNINPKQIYSDGFPPGPSSRPPSPDSDSKETNIIAKTTGKTKYVIRRKLKYVTSNEKIVRSCNADRIGQSVASRNTSKDNFSPNTISRPNFSDSVNNVAIISHAKERNIIARPGEGSKYGIKRETVLVQSNVKSVNSCDSNGTSQSVTPKQIYSNGRQPSPNSTPSSSDSVNVVANISDFKEANTTKNAGNSKYGIRRRPILVASN